MSDHLIVGGGIIGLLTAHYLQLDGASVTIIERQQVGKESSWAGGGILSPLYPWRYDEAVTQLANWSQRHYPELIDQLFNATQIDAQYTTSGMLVLDENEQTQALQWAQQQSSNTNAHIKTHIEVIDQEKIHSLEPGLSNPPATAIWMPHIAQLRNPRFIKALKQSLLKRNVNIIENQQITQLIVNQEQINGIRTDDQEFHCNSIIFASGAWTADILRPYGVSLDVQPVKGQMLLFKAHPELVNTILLSDSHYLIPRQDGRILVGSTLEYVGFNKNTTVHAEGELMECAYSLIPELEQFPIEYHWAGLRPGTQQGIPFISEHPSIQGLYVNVGHFRNGVVTAPASAKICAEIVQKTRSAIDVSPYKI